MDAATAAPRANAHHSRRWVILGFLGLAQLMVVLDATIVNVAMPSIQSSLGFSIVDRQWLITAYSLAFGCLLFLGGRLSDLIGRKTTLQIGPRSASRSPRRSAVPRQSFPMLVTASAIQGAFGAVLAPAALAMVTTAFTDPKERGKAFGIYGSIAGAGAALGLLLGGLLTQYLDWRWTLYVNLIFAGDRPRRHPAAARARARGRRTAASTSRAPALISGGLFAIVYGLSHAATSAENASTAGQSVTLASAFGNPADDRAASSAGIALVAAFLVRQRRAIRADAAPRRASRTVRAAARSSRSPSPPHRCSRCSCSSPTSCRGARATRRCTQALRSCRWSSCCRRRPPRRHDAPAQPVRAEAARSRPACASARWACSSFTRLTVGSSYVTHVLPGLLITGMAMGLVFATAMNTATARVAARVRRLGVGVGQRHPAGRRLDRHGPALDGLDLRHAGLPDDARASGLQQGDARDGDDAREHRTGPRVDRGLLVGRRAVRDGCGPRRG